MSEKRFELTKINPTVNLSDTVYFIIDYENPNKEIRTLKDCVDLLNEQQELIEELKVSDEMGWKRAEHFEKKCPKELHNKKMYIKRLEYKVQKFKEMNGEQQATISKLEEEKGYWKSKAMTLLMQVRRLTPRMTDKEVMEFSKELEDE